MNWLNKLFGKRTEEPQDAAIHQTNATHSANATSVFEGLEGIRFGRYSDNNKSKSKTQSWYIAEDRFKEKNHMAFLDAFFDYLTDEAEQNVVLEKQAGVYRFTLYQGSKKVHGTIEGDKILASSPLAVMEEPGTAIMRRLLEMNYSLYYSHCALDEGNTLCMVFLADVPTTNPSKLYYGLRELATKADRQDDLLLSDFSALRPTDTDHIQPLPDKELTTKYHFFKKWIGDALSRVSDLNQDSFSGAIAYLLLTVIYRIDFFMQPESKLLSELEKINGYYWEKKDEIALVERNQMMKEGLRKLLEFSFEDFSRSLYRSRSTFSTVAPPKPEKVRDHIISANKDSAWYVENKYPDIALVINEYGALYNQFIYSMPKVQTDLIQLYMAVLHADYFEALGMKQNLYHRQAQKFEAEKITRAIDQIITENTEKYKSLRWDHNRISFDSLYAFGVDFTDQLSALNLETKRET